MNRTPLSESMPILSPTARRGVAGALGALLRSPCAPRDGVAVSAPHAISTPSYPRLRVRKEGLDRVCDTGEPGGDARLPLLARLPQPPAGSVCHSFNPSALLTRVARASPRTCQAAHGWVKGPVAVTGATLRRFGAQAVRTHEGCVDSIPGVELGCEPIARWCVLASLRIITIEAPSAFDRRYAPNASWHLSSLSGGVRGHLSKLRQTYRGATEGDAREGTPQPQRCALVDAPSRPLVAVRRSCCARAARGRHQATVRAPPEQVGGRR